MSREVLFEKKVQKIGRVWGVDCYPPERPTGRCDWLSYRGRSQAVAKKQWIPRTASNERLSGQTR